MVGVLSLTITFHTVTITNATLSLQTAVADAAAAQALTTAIKTFLANGGATVDQVSGNFTPQSSGVV